MVINPLFIRLADQSEDLTLTLDSSLFRRYVRSIMKARQHDWAFLSVPRVYLYPLLVTLQCHDPNLPRPRPSIVVSVWEAFFSVQAMTSVSIAQRILGASSSFIKSINIPSLWPSLQLPTPAIPTFEAN